MHISEGILSLPVLAAGAALATAGAGVGLKKLDHDRIPRAGILSAAFFVASLVRVPIGPASIHLIFNGAVGLLLGWAAFPTILVALILQTVFFQFGVLTTLGATTIVMALPAVICYLCFAPLIRKSRVWSVSAAFAAGSLSVFLSGIIVGGALMFTEQGFLEVAGLVVAAHVPVMVIEGIITVFLVLFLKKVQPDLLPAGKSFSHDQ